MSETVIRRPIDHSVRHMNSTLLGCYENFNDQSHPQGLFRYRQQWSLKGIRRTDLDQISDLQPYVVIQNPTPFGYYVKQSQFLRSTGPNGQPSATVPRVGLYKEPVVNRSLAPIAFSTSVMGPSKLVDRDPGPKAGPIVKGDFGQTSQLIDVQGFSVPAFVPSMKGTFKRAAESMAPENKPSKINKRFGTFIGQNQQKQEFDREKTILKKENRSRRVLVNFSVNPDKINN